MKGGSLKGCFSLRWQSLAESKKSASLIPFGMPLLWHFCHLESPSGERWGGLHPHKVWVGVVGTNFAAGKVPPIHPLEQRTEQNLSHM